jgi:glycosyltransferase involved in cell wall biosynthesis
MDIVYYLRLVSMGSKPGRVKVLYTIPNFDTAGSGKALLKIAERLDANRFEPEICCMHDQGAFFKEVQASGIPVHIFPYTADMSQRVSGLLHVWKVSMFFRSLKPDLIHSFHYAPDYSEALAAKLAGVKWVYTKKNMNWGGSSRNSWRLRSWLADGIIAQNTDMMRDFFTGWKKVALVPRGVDIEAYVPPVYEAPEVYLSTADQIRWTLICVANIVPVKGIDILLQAFNTMSAANPGLHLFIVGDDSNDHAKDLKRYAALNLPGKVTFTGKVQDVSYYLQKSDIFILPTLNEGRQEGSPVALLEAMAAGLPVIASDVAGIRDQLEPFKSLLSKPGDANDLAEKIDGLIKTGKKACQVLGETLHFHVKTNHSIELETAKHEIMYENVLNGFNRKR